jgi:hypothetical protein
MRTMNKMNDFDAKFKEWWEVTKELEKNLVQHKIDERNLKYKLEIYQRNFPNFVKALG